MTVETGRERASEIEEFPHFLALLRWVVSAAHTAAGEMSRTASAERGPRSVTRVMCSGVVRQEGLFGWLEVNTYRRPSPPNLTIRFSRRTDSTLRRVSVRIGINSPTGKLWPEGFGEPPQLLRRPVTYRKDLRQLWWTTARKAASRSPGGDDHLWWVEPGRTSEELTQFVLVIYLWRAGLINPPVPDTPAWAFLKRFLQGPRHASPSDADMWEVLSKVTKRYVLPQDWKECRVYLGRVFKSVRSRCPRLKARADDLGVSLPTLYRWIRQDRTSNGQKGKLDEQGWARIAQRAERRRLRQKAIGLLLDRGRGTEAARKVVQRRMREGRFEALLRELTMCSPAERGFS